MQGLPEEYLDLLEDDVRAFAFLATIMPDMTPQVTPLWFNTDGEYLLINSAKGRTKDRNMRARPQVALVIMDLFSPYRFIQIRGEVVEVTEEGAKAHIDVLTKKYTGREHFTPGSPTEVRVTYKIKPVHINAIG